MKIPKSFIGAGISILAIAGYLGFSGEEFTPEEILQIEAQAQQLFGGNANNVKKRIFNEMRPATVKLKGKDWELTGMHFKTLLKENADDGWEYEENGKKLGFVSEGMAWDGDKVKTKAEKVKGEISELTVRYDDALGEGIDIKIVQDNYHFQKIIEIESLASLGEIPEGAEYLEFSFKLSGDFDLPEGEIIERIPFGENSFLQPVRAWDSSTDSYDEENPNLMSGAFGEITGKVLTKKIPVAWLFSATFPVSTDATITFGSENVFNSANTSFVSVAALDDTHFVVAYNDGGNSSKGTVIIGVTDGDTTISSYGSESIFNDDPTNHISVAALDSTHFVVAYDDFGNSDFGTARVGVTDGSTSISSYGAENVFNSAVTKNTALTALDSTHFVVAYEDDGDADFGIARVGVVSGTTISSYGSENAFNAAATSDISVATLDSTHFVAAYKDEGASGFGTARVGVVSSTTISSYGAESAFRSENTGSVSVSALDSTHFVVGFISFVDDKGYARVGAVSGTTISSYGTVSAFNDPATNFVSVTALDSTNFIVGYSSTTGKARAGLTDGSTEISSYGDEAVFNAASTSDIALTSLSTSHFVVAFKDEGNSNHGTAIVGSIPAPEVLGTGNFFQLF